MQPAAYVQIWPIYGTSASSLAYECLAMQCASLAFAPAMLDFPRGGLPSFMVVAALCGIPRQNDSISRNALLVTRRGR